MNERIRQLALQAGFQTDEANLSFGNYIQDKEYFYADDFIQDELKKFAELMVEEFQTILRNNRGQDTGTLSYRVEEHFRS